MTGTHWRVYTPWADLTPQAPTRECATWRNMRPQAPERVQIKEDHEYTPIAQRRESAWRGGPEAAPVLVGTEKNWARMPELAAAKKTSKTGLSSLKAAGLFFFF